MPDIPPESEYPKNPKLSKVPEATVVNKPSWVPQLVWLMPIMVALIGAWIAIQTITDHGPTIIILFKTADGLEAGKTKIKYKNVDIGQVKSITLSKDRSDVVVTAQMVKEFADSLVEDTHFWVVRPRISAGSISGLGTLLSGSYIGVDVGKSTKEQEEFRGFETGPIITGDLPGRQYVLNGDDLGSLDIGSPVYFRRIKVGQVVAYDLAKNGNGVVLKVFINAPYDQYVTTNTRFWHASGVDVTLDVSGIRVDTESLTSILIGGVTFQAPPDLPIAPPAEANTTFKLSENRSMAMKQPDKEVHTYLLYFRESLRGLSPGAPVDFHGILIGEVKSLGIEYDRTAKIFRFPVEIDVYPERLNTRYRQGAPRAETITLNNRKILLNQLIERGLRAQLKTGNLLTGQLYVALDMFPDVPIAKMNWNSTPPEMPTVTGSLEDLQVTLAHLAKKFDKMPLDALVADLRHTLKSLDTTLQSSDKLVKHFDTELTPEIKATLEDARKTLGSAQKTLASDSPLQQDLHQTLQELSRAAQSLRVLSDMLERHPEALIRGKKEDTP